MPDTDAPLHWNDWLFLSKGGLTLPWLMHADGVWLWDVPVWRMVEGVGEVTGGASVTPEFLALTWGLSLYTSAFVAELVRAGILSVPRGQTEAAKSIGLSAWQMQRLVVLPQAMRVVIPPLTNQYLNLIKNSSLAVAIGYPDLVNISNTALNQTGRAVECIAIVMAVYLSLSLLTAALMNAYNRRMALKAR
jgi:general L-amino acid transport system permease protein